MESEFKEKAPRDEETNSRGCHLILMSWTWHAEKAVVILGNGGDLDTTEGWMSGRRRKS